MLNQVQLLKSHGHEVVVSLVASLAVDFVWKKIFIINHLLKKYE